VKMKDGRVFSEYVDRAIGEPYTPLSREGLIAKFMEQIEFSGLVRSKEAARIIKLVDNLEQVADVSSITRLTARRAE